MSNKTSDRHAQPLGGGIKVAEKKGVAGEASSQVQGLNTRAMGRVFLFAS